MIPINHTGDNGWLTMNWMDGVRLLPPQLPSTALHQLAHVNEGTDDAGFLSASRKLHRRMPRTKYPGMVEPKWRALLRSRLITHCRKLRWRRHEETPIGIILFFVTIELAWLFHSHDGDSGSQCVATVQQGRQVGGQVGVRNTI